MFSAVFIRRFAIFNVLVMLTAASLPAGAAAQCACAPGGCSSLPKAGCCSAGEKPQTKSCCSQAKPAPKQHCCCTDLTGTKCSHEANNAVDNGCECSPVRPDQPPAQTPAPTLTAKVVATAILPPWADTFLHLDLKAWSPKAADLALHAPPIPLRELYCVWRI